ncbi:MAG: hypothetical protein WC054_00085 [Candidatus Nanopelagicales bacterium]
MTNTKTINARFITEALECAQVWDARVRNDYSGRGMYGEECFGITFDGRSDPFRFFASLGELVGEQQEFDEPDLEQGFAVVLAQRACMDSMGLGTVLYFPGYQLEGDIPGTDEDD